MTGNSQPKPALPDDTGETAPIARFGVAFTVFARRTIPARDGRPDATTDVGLANSREKAGVRTNACGHDVSANTVGSGVTQGLEVGMYRSDSQRDEQQGLRAAEFRRGSPETPGSH